VSPASPRGDAPLTAVIAPDSFKGSFTSVQVANALAAGDAEQRVERCDEL
jgi:glycerate kinase